jgi:hypothetical protein
MRCSTSAIGSFSAPSIGSPSSWNQGSGFNRFLSNFTIAPIFEISSGRPFNILSNQDTNNDQSNQTDRPAVLADGTLCVPGTVGCTPLITNGQFSSGSLPRNYGITHRYVSLDMRVAKLVPIGERVRLELIAEGIQPVQSLQRSSRVAIHRRRPQLQPARRKRPLLQPPDRGV